MCYKTHFLYFCVKIFYYGIASRRKKIIFYLHAWDWRGFKMAKTNDIDYAKELIKAGLKRELILKMTSISEYEYNLIQRELATA